MINFKELLRKSETVILPHFNSDTEALMKGLESTEKTFWNVPREVGELMYRLLVSNDALKILEVGTSNGYSGLWLGSAIKANLGSRTEVGLITIESHEGRFLLARDNFLKTGLTPYVKQIKGHAPEAFDDQDIKAGGFDALFFDATKKQHVDFFNQGVPLLKQGGLLIADNILSHWDAMEAFVKTVEQSDLFDGEVLKIGQGVYVGLKK